MINDFKNIKTFREMVDYSANFFGDNDAYAYWNKDCSDKLSVTFKEFKNDVDKLGSWLIEKGFKNKHIAIVGENSYAWLLSFYSIICSGNVVLPIDKNMNPETMGNVLKFNDCELILISDEYSDVGEKIKLETGIEYINFGSIYDNETLLVLGSDQSIKEYNNLMVSKEDKAAIFFTSGTLGINKGVVLSNYNLISEAVYGRMALLIKDLNVYILPYFHTFAMVTVLITFINGGTVFIEPSFRKIASDIIKLHPRITAVVPALLPIAYQTFSSVKYEGDRILICGGAPSNPEWIVKFKEINVKLSCGYGMTECSPIIACNLDNEYREDGFLRILPLNEVKISNPNSDGVGEIMVRGLNVTSGYYKLDEENKKLFTDGWLHTGDLGKLDGDYLAVVGRIKNILVLPNGENVSAEEVELQIQEIHGVRECVALVGENGVEVEVFAPDADEQTIRNQVAEINKQRSASKRIMKVNFRENEFPKNSTGKIIRR